MATWYPGLQPPPLFHDPAGSSSQINALQRQLAESMQMNREMKANLAETNEFWGKKIATMDQEITAALRKESKRNAAKLASQMGSLTDRLELMERYQKEDYDVLREELEIAEIRLDRLDPPLPTDDASNASDSELMIGTLLKLEDRVLLMENIVAPFIEGSKRRRRTPPERYSP